ncbi:hypothetical protein FHV99_004635 [Ochrobactrum sp. P20RRXII]|nr:hypothetical protein [Ochrobactrum sp. P20RRXII]
MTRLFLISVGVYALFVAASYVSPSANLIQW